MNIYTIIIALVACFTLKTFAAEQTQQESTSLSTKQLEIIVKTIKTQPKSSKSN